jgi:hypothetical protein
MNFSFNLGMSGCTIIGVVFILIFRFFFVGDFRGSRLVYLRLGLTTAEGATKGICSTICAIGGSTIGGATISGSTIGGSTIGGSTIGGSTIGNCFRVYLRFTGATASAGAAGAAIRFVYLRFGASGSRFLYVRFGFGIGSIFIVYNRTINFLLLNYNGTQRIAFRSNFIRTLRCIFGVSAIHTPRSDTVC